MKILYFVASYKNYTGSQRSLMLMVRHLPPHVKRYVVFPGEGRAVEAARKLHIPHTVLEAPPSLNQFEKQALMWSAIEQVRIILRDLIPYTATLLRLIRQEKPDIIHCNDVRSVLLIGTAARLARKPVVWHIRSLNVLKSHGPIDFITHRFATMAITVADALKTEVRRGLPVSTVYNGIDLSSSPDPSPASRELQTRALQHNLDPRAVTFLVASSLVPYKGHHHLLHALSALLRERPEYKRWVALLILGDASTRQQRRYLEYLVDLSRNLELERNILWLGWRDDSVAWMHASDVVVLPTVKKEQFRYPDGDTLQLLCAEGFPRVILEAMSAGRPVIATDVAGVPEAVDDKKTGLLVSPSSPDGLKDAMATLIDSPTLRAEMGERAHERGRLFTIARTVHDTMQVYHALLARQNVPNAALRHLSRHIRR